MAAQVAGHVPLPRPPPPCAILLETSALHCAGVKPLEVQRLSLFLFLPASDTLQKRAF
jgi:hypothetical protein